MRKTFTTLFLIFLLSVTGFSQSLEVVDTETNISGKVGGEDISAIIKVKNTSKAPVRLQIIRTDNELASGQLSYFCLENKCGDAFEDIFPEIITIHPGEIYQGFASILEPGLAESKSKVTYKLVNLEKPNDFTEITLNYLVESSTSRGTLYYDNDLRISDLYPNPVDKIAIFDYELDEDSDVDAKIIIQNVLGSILSEHELATYEEKIKVSTESLSPGVYFYTLQLDNQNLVTKKFIIKR